MAGKPAQRLPTRRRKRRRIKSRPEPARQSRPTAPDANSPSHADSSTCRCRITKMFAEAASALAASLSALAGEAETASEPQGASGAVVIPQHDYEAAAGPPCGRPAGACSALAYRGSRLCVSSAEHGPKWHAVESSDQSSQPHALLAVPQLLPSPGRRSGGFVRACAEARRHVASFGASDVCRKARADAVGIGRIGNRSDGSAAGDADVAKSDGPTVRPLPPRPAPVSPLAALRGLTEEELIALFG